MIARSWSHKAQSCGCVRDRSQNTQKTAQLNQTIGELDIENFFPRNVPIAIASFVPSREQFVRQHKTLQSPSAISIDGRGKIPDATNNQRFQLIFHLVIRKHDKNDADGF